MDSILNIQANVISSHLDRPPTQFASEAAFEMAGLGPKDVDVIQIQDTESGAEIMHMAENGFCEHGDQEHLIRSQRVGYGRGSAVPRQHRPDGSAAGVAGMTILLKLLVAVVWVLWVAYECGEF